MPGFEEVETEFKKNFLERGELGAACAIYHRGEKVVDLWGGYRDRKTGDLWKDETLVLVFSTTKGISALTVAVAHSRGLLDYDEKVAAYWPEFAQAGKENVTVRELLAHQAGLCAIGEPLSPEVLADLDRLAAVLARQRPAWRPGTKHGYHYLSLGSYENELIRRDTKSEAATATPLAITVVVDGGPAPPSAALYSILSHALQSSLKATSNVCIAGERVLDDPEDPTGETTAQIGLYTPQGQDGRISCNPPGARTPAYPPPYRRPAKTLVGRDLKYDKSSSPASL